MNNNTIISGFLSNSIGTDLFLHYMQGTNKKFWIFCNPILEESIYIRPFYQEIARYLNAQGDHVIQFDYSGCGESCGDFSQVTLQTMLDDVSSIIQHIEKDKLTHPTKKIILFGMRIGANIALTIAKNTHYPCLAWLPISDGKRFCNHLLLTNMSIQMTAFGKVKKDNKELLEELSDKKHINILGYSVSHLIFQELEKISTHDFLFECSPANLITICIDQSPAHKNIIKLIKNKKLKIDIIKIKPFWHEPKIYPEKQTQLLALINKFQEKLNHADSISSLTKLKAEALCCS